MPGGGRRVNARARDARPGRRSSRCPQVVARSLRASVFARSGSARSPCSAEASQIGGGASPTNRHSLIPLADQVIAPGVRRARGTANDFSVIDRVRSPDEPPETRGRDCLPSPMRQRHSSPTRITADPSFLTRFLPKPYADPHDGAARIPYPRRRVQCTRESRVTPADETRNALPVEWAFVVHLRPGALPEEGRLAGRVEHFVSGRSEHFGSLPELLAFLGRVLKNLEKTASRERPSREKRGEGTHVGRA